MQFFSLVACLLASFAAANPVEVERRAFGQGMSAASQRHTASTTSVNGGVVGGGLGGVAGGLGGFGPGMGGVAGGMSSSYRSQSSSSYSYSSALGSFSTLGSQIGAIRSMMAGGGFTQAIAIQQMRRLAASMQAALVSSAGCGCLGQGGLFGSVTSVFSQFSSLMMSMQSMFGGSIGPLLQPFQSLSGSFRSFFQSSQQFGYSASRIVPPGLSSLFANVIPGFPGMLAHK